jgi:hemolysin activation/secretion protein
MRNEAELPLREQLSTYLGLDAGWVSGRGVERLAGRHLAGAVLGARWRHVGVQLDVFAGTALQRPSNFPSGQWVAGFSLSYSP